MDLTKFCAPNDPRHYLHKPIRHDGYLYATNGFIAVRIEDDPKIDADPMPENMRGGTLEKMASDSTARAWHPLPAVDAMEAKPCGACNETGRLAKCASCDGEGSFDYFGHSYDCKRCNGSGQIASQSNQEGSVCGDCQGSGVNWRNTVEFSGVHIAERYIHLIGTEIPGAEIGISNLPTGIQLFRAPGVIGAVMPVRVSW